MLATATDDETRYLATFLTRASAPYPAVNGGRPAGLRQLVRAVDLHHAIAKREEHRLQLGVDTQLGEDVRDVVAVRAWRHPQTSGGRTVVESVRQELQDFALPRGEA